MGGGIAAFRLGMGGYGLGSVLCDEGVSVRVAVF